MAFSEVSGASKLIQAHNMSYPKKDLLLLIIFSTDPTVVLLAQPKAVSHLSKKPIMVQISLAFNSILRSGAVLCKLALCILPVRLVIILFDSFGLLIFYPARKIGP